MKTQCLAKAKTVGKKAKLVYNIFFPTNLDLLYIILF